MARPTTKGSSRSTREREAMAGNGGPEVRYGLATKFTVPVALCISLLIIVLSMFSYQSMARGLETQADIQGVFAARLAAAPPIDSWDQDYNTVTDLQRRIAEIDVALTLAGSRIDVEPGKPLTEEQQKLRAQLARYDEAQRGVNRKRLSGLLSQGVLDVWILAGKDELKASASGATKLKYTTERNYEAPFSRESLISLGEYLYQDESDDKRTRARFYRHPITDLTGRVIGSATVIFSEQGLIASLDELRTRSLILCILGVIGTATAAFFTGRLITRPLGYLVKDIKAVSDGNLAHRTVARSRDEIGTLAVTFDEMTRNLEAAETVRLELAAKAHEVSIAQEVQDRLFPKAMPTVAGLAIEGKNILSAELSSDLFDARVFQDGRVGILVMTASGRGVPAAIVLSMARSLFRARAELHSTPSETLSDINALLSPDLRRGMFVSAAYAIIDPVTGNGSVVAPGHRAPILHYVAASQGGRRLAAGGIALGLDKGPVFDRSLALVTFTLAPNDRLILASEGALQVKDTAGQELGEEGFLRLMVGGAKRGSDAAALLQTLLERREGEPPGQDITLVQATKAS